MWMLKHKQKSVHNKSKKWKKTSTDHRSARIWAVDELRFSLFFLQWFHFDLIGERLKRKVKQFLFVRNLQVRPPPPLPLPFDVIEIGRRRLFQIFTLIDECRVRCVCDCWPRLPPYRRSAAENQQWISRHRRIWQLSSIQIDFHNRQNFFIQPFS